MSKQPRTSLSTTTRAPLRVNLPWYNNNPFVILPSTERVRKFTGCYFLFRDPMAPIFVGPVIQHKEKIFNCD